MTRVAQQKPHVLMEGIGLGESPRWHEGRLWFSDWVAQELIALDLGGRSEGIAKVRSLPFSIDWLPDGPLLITSGQELLRMEPDGSLVTHVDLSDLSEHGWNEIVVDARGNAYVNNIDFDMMGGEEPKPGIIGVVTPDGETRQVADGLAFPNGMVVTPDSSTLIVAESYEGRLTAFDIDEGGGLSNRRVWADLGEGGDGICMDAEGAVWSPKFRTCVRVAEGGEVLDEIELDRFCFACMLGGKDGRTLFMNVAEWNGPDQIGKGPRTGQVLTVEAPAAHAGRP
ncbi:MAG TPA: SMP-30/gluconolactonase/LRE family protein [Solirubrobacterales bacterium]|nr:SMP-30/gluconolactonase/LRE family protein [Solirubrobacterales bacterium]